MNDALDPLRVAHLVGSVMDALGISYSVGGSLASSFSGEPRSTLDVDVVADLTADQIAPLVAALREDFYIDQDALSRAVRERSSTNLIHLASSTKVDVFVAGGTALDRQLLDRRIPVDLGVAAGRLYVHSPEDILLQKLRWYRRGGEVSDRQWRDILGIVRVQAERLDRSYAERGAVQLEVGDLFLRALRDAEA